MSAAAGKWEGLPPLSQASAMLYSGLEIQIEINNDR